MTNQATIANRALTKIGATRIVALSDDTTQARVLSAMWDAVLNDELRARRWSFAIARAQLAADATPPQFGYDNRFLLPSDYVRLLMVGTTFPGGNPYLPRNAPDGDEWAIEDGYILVNDAGPLNVRYLRRVTDTSAWDANFVEVFACRLAAEACETITQSSEKRQLAWQEYERAVIKAARAGAIELPPRVIADDTWLTARTIG